jgi:predicted site-specific integrase-resolvase
MVTMSPAAFARLVGVSRARMSVLLKTGRVPGAVKDGRNWRIPEGARIIQSNHPKSNAKISIEFLM